MNSCAEGSGENTNNARPVTMPDLVPASVLPRALRLARRSGDSRPPSVRAPTARAGRPAVAASAQPTISAPTRTGVLSA